MSKLSIINCAGVFWWVMTSNTRCLTRVICSSQVKLPFKSARTKTPFTKKPISCSSSFTLRPAVGIPIQKSCCWACRDSTTCKAAIKPINSVMPFFWHSSIRVEASLSSKSKWYFAPFVVWISGLGRSVGNAKSEGTSCN